MRRRKNRQQPNKKPTFKSKCHFRECTTVQGVRNSVIDKLETLAPLYELLNADAQTMTSAMLAVWDATKQTEDTWQLVRILKEKSKKAKSNRVAKQINLYAGQIERAYKRKLKEKQEAEEATKEV